MYYLIFLLKATNVVEIMINSYFLFNMPSLLELLKTWSGPEKKTFGDK